MRQLKEYVVLGLMVVTLTVLLNPHSAEAAECTDGTCKNGGMCPTEGDAAGQTPCDCSASAYVGDTCEDQVCADGGSECRNGGACNTTATPNVCQCGAYKGKTCEDACATNVDCGTGGTCNIDASPKTCTCKAGYDGDQCTVEPECMDDSGCTGEHKMCNVYETPYVCACKDGYGGDQCTVEPECIDDSGCTGENEMCRVDVTPYVCACKPGYKQDTNTNKCMESGSAFVQVSLVSMVISLIVHAL